MDLFGNDWTSMGATKENLDGRETMNNCHRIISWDLPTPYFYSQDSSEIRI